MVQARFLEFVTDVFDYFERKAPKDNTMDLWFDEVRNIPDEALEWIKSKIFKENDNKPSNLPATMWALYNAWLQAHPEKRAHRESVNCPDCEGGWLVLQKEILNKFGKPMYRDAIPTFTAPCGKCRQIPMKNYTTLFQAIEQGYERVNLNSHTVVKRSLKAMVDSVGRPMPKARVYAD